MYVGTGPFERYRFYPSARTERMCVHLNLAPQFRDRHKTEVCAHASHKGSQSVRFTFADKLPISLADLCIELLKLGDIRLDNRLNQTIRN